MNRIFGVFAQPMYKVCFFSKINKLSRPYSIKTWNQAADVNNAVIKNRRLFICNKVFKICYTKMQYISAPMYFIKYVIKWPMF